MTTNLEDLLKRKDDVLFLKDSIFENKIFSDFQIHMSEGKVVLENLQFINCTVSSGACLIHKEFTLRNVMFSGLDCGDNMHIDSEAILDKVVIKGKNQPKCLWVQPQEKGSYRMPNSSSIDFHFDISDFIGEVIIVGLPVNKIIRNPNFHVGVKASWKNDVDWNGLRISKNSYWKIFVRKLLSFQVEEGVFSLPAQVNKYYQETIEEMKRLRDFGLTF